MTHPKTLVFDFGGVLFNTSATAFYRDLFQQQGHSDEELDYFLNTVFTNHDRSVSNTGNAKEIIDAKSHLHPEWTEQIKAYGADRDFLKTIRAVLPGTIDLLSEMKADGHRLVGLTNWHGDTYDALFAAYPEILGRFDTIVVSGKVGLRKPNAEIFRLAQAEYGKPDPSDVYYFDDKPKNTQAAIEAVGWNAFPFTDANTVRQALAYAPKPL